MKYLRSSRASSRGALGLLLTLALWASAPEARAADAEATATAQALYDQAVTAMDKRAYGEACPKLEEAVRLVPEGVGAKLTLAECYEGLGRLAAAWATYNLAEAQAARSGQPDRQKLAADRRAALEPRLPRLRIEVPPEVARLEGLTILRDGIAVGAAQRDLALPVDQGEHRVVARAPGYRAWEGTVPVATPGATVSVRIPPLEAEPSAAAPAAPSAAVVPRSAAPSSAASPAPAAASDGGGPSGRELVGYASLGLGVVGLAVGGVFGASAMSKKSEAEEGHCVNGNHCDAEGVTLLEDSLSAGDLSTVFVIAGAACAGLGVVLLATAPDEAPRAALRLGPGGASLAGSFQ